MGFIEKKDIIGYVFKDGIIIQKVLCVECAYRYYINELTEEDVLEREEAELQGIEYFCDECGALLC